MTLRNVSTALESSKWTILAGGALGSVLVYSWLISPSLAAKKRLKAATISDPSLLRKHSTYESYTTSSGFAYPSIRTFYKEHQQAEKLPTDLPLLVFMHGLGGSASQFAPLLASLINLAPCLAIDLPGCGLSEYTPWNPEAYTTQALAELLAAVVKRHLDSKNSRKAVFIGHSMGCSITALLASSTSPLAHLLDGSVIGMISICPSSGATSASQISAMRRISSLPVLLFDIFRWYDRRGGIDSASVERMVGKHADEKTKTLQLKYNEQSQSHVFLRMLGRGIGRRGFPRKNTWAGVKVPLFLITGEADTVTPPAEVEKIMDWLTHPDAKEHTEQRSADETASSADSIADLREQHVSSKHSTALKTTIFPKPSGHALMYTISIDRILAGMIENFLANHIDERLGASWQLQHLTTSGKWDVKNLKKWQAVEACSVPIGGIFRAMKTMREVDDVHCPKEFVKNFSYSAIPDGVRYVIDISYESPVYHPQGLEDAGVEYHKFPTVSKEKPKPSEVEHFISMIDDIRKSDESIAPATIGVHCHYGFNRTGFFIVCYLVERMGYKLQDALDEFAQKREPGIKHPHFETELFVRYAVKMERRGTVYK